MSDKISDRPFAVLDAPSPQDSQLTVQLEIRHETFRRYVQAGFRTAIAQYYGVVVGGLITTKHLFRGLKRPLLHDGDMDGDENVLVYAWQPAYDCVWTASGGRFGASIMEVTPPAERVFVVLVREHAPASGRGIVGSIEHWNWVYEDPRLRYAPVDWEQRYTRKLWSKD